MNHTWLTDAGLTGDSSSKSPQEEQFSGCQVLIIVCCEWCSGSRATFFPWGFCLKKRVTPTGGWRVCSWPTLSSWNRVRRKRVERNQWRKQEEVMWSVTGMSILLFIHVFAEGHAFSERMLQLNTKWKREKKWERSRTKINELEKERGFETKKERQTERKRGTPSSVRLLYSFCPFFFFMHPSSLLYLSKESCRCLLQWNKE